MIQYFAKSLVELMSDRLKNIVNLLLPVILQYCEHIEQWANGILQKINCLPDLWRAIVRSEFSQFLDGPAPTVAVKMRRGADWFLCLAVEGEDSGEAGALGIEAEDWGAVGIRNRSWFCEVSISDFLFHEINYILS